MNTCWDGIKGNFTWVKTSTAFFLNHLHARLYAPMLSDVRFSSGTSSLIRRMKAAIAFSCTPRWGLPFGNFAAAFAAVWVPSHLSVVGVSMALMSAIRSTKAQISGRPYLQGQTKNNIRCTLMYHIYEYGMSVNVCGMYMYMNMCWVHVGVRLFSTATGKDVWCRSNRIDKIFIVPTCYAALTVQNTQNTTYPFYLHCPNQYLASWEQSLLYPVNVLLFVTYVCK